MHQRKIVLVITTNDDDIDDIDDRENALCDTHKTHAYNQQPQQQHTRKHANILHTHNNPTNKHIHKRARRRPFCKCVFIINFSQSRRGAFDRCVVIHKRRAMRTSYLFVVYTVENTRRFAFCLALAGVRVFWLVTCINGCTTGRGGKVRSVAHTQKTQRVRYKLRSCFDIV